MLYYWTNFAESGNPNSEELPEWEKLLPCENKWQVLGSEVGKKDIDRIEIYDLLQDFEYKGI